MTDEFVPRPGKVSIWSLEKPEGRRPPLSGTVVAHRDIREGEEFEIAVWPNAGYERDIKEKGSSKKPRYTGKASDKRQENNPMDYFQPKKIDDDIPFS